MQTLWVQKGQLGSTVFYQAIMTAEEIINTVGLAIELPEWKGMTADEKMQREPDINRICNEIVPYFTNDDDRFFGSIIVDIFTGFEDVVFRPIKDIIQGEGLKMEYSLPAQDAGFLFLPGKER